MSEDMVEGWREVRLGEVFVETNSRLGDAIPPEIMSVAKAGIIPQSDTYDKRVSSADLSNYKLLDPGKFALAPMALYYGAIGRHRGEDAALVSPAYVTFEPYGDVDADYLAHLIRLPRMIDRYAALAQGGNLEGKRKITSFDAFCSIKRYMPSPAEQRAIASVLEAADATVAASEVEIGATSRQKRQVMRGLLTHGTGREGEDLVPLEDRWVAGRVAEGIEAIPRGWSLVRLTSVARLESGHTPSRNHPEYWDGDVPWVSLNDTGRLDGMTIDETEETVAELGLRNSSARLLPTDTVLFSRTATVGKITRLGRPMATSQDFANWVCGDDLSPRYLAQVFRACGREWRRLQSGSTHQTIYMPDFKRLQILLPPLPEQHRIAEIGEAFDARVEAERAVLARARERKTALASELLSGRTRLPPAMIARHASPARAAA